MPYTPPEPAPSEDSTYTPPEPVAPASAPPDYSGYAGALLGLGISTSPFQALIDQAVAESWTASQLQNAIIASPEFEAMFPGIKRPDGSLRMSAVEWRQIAEAYYQIGRDYRINIGPAQVGMLLSGDKSPNEFLQQARIAREYMDNPNMLADYNAVREARGMAPLDEQTFFNGLASQTKPEFYDDYEATRILGTGGLDIDARGALGVAQAIGTPGEFTDLRQLAQDVRDIKRDIGPELLQAGITDADVLKLEGGVDERGIAPSVRAIIANRRAQGRFVPGSAARTGAAGGAATLPEDRPESY